MLRTTHNKIHGGMDVGGCNMSVMRWISCMPVHHSTLASAIKGGGWAVPVHRAGLGRTFPSTGDVDTIGEGTTRITVRLVITAAHGIIFTSTHLGSWGTRAEAGRHATTVQGAILLSGTITVGCTLDLFLVPATDGKTIVRCNVTVVLSRATGAAAAAVRHTIERLSAIRAGNGFRGRSRRVRLLLHGGEPRVVGIDHRGSVVSGLTGPARG